MLRLLKFTLDLFDVAPVYEPSQIAPQKRLQKRPPKAPSERPEKVTQPPTPLLPASGDVFSRHPEASQQTRLVGHMVDYELLRSRRRTMTFSVSPIGLSVHAPFGMPQPTIESAVQEKARWIVRKLAGMQQREERMAALKMDWQGGAQLAYLGGTLKVSVDPHAARTALIATPTSADQTGNQAGKAWDLMLKLPAISDDKKIRDTTKKWLLQQATQHYTARMNHYADLLGVKWRTLTLTNANTRWGSAKADGTIRLHWRLMQFSPDVIDYVVAHELSHLRELNHSPRFWATVASVLPDYEARQKQLKAQVLPPWE
jgi:predicted metal-dependent hydrolase